MNSTNNRPMFGRSDEENMLYVKEVEKKVNEMFACWEKDPENAKTESEKILRDIGAII